MLEMPGRQKSGEPVRSVECDLTQGIDEVLVCGKWSQIKCAIRAYDGRSKGCGVVVLGVA